MKKQPVKKTLDVLALKPADTPDYMTIAWLDCMRWAISEPDVLAKFRADTGLTWQPSRNGIEKAIDEATGASAGFIEAFILWANVNVWGPMDDGLPVEDESA